jgi:hypothetical protein
MHKLLSFLRSKPVFIILLPLFFMLHGFMDNYYAVPLKEALLLLLMYVVASSIFFLVGWLFFKQLFKAAIFSFCVMAFHFFFGAIQDFLKAAFHESFVTHYSFILSFFFIVFVAIVWFLKRTRRPMKRVAYYLNILFYILILIDTVWLTQKIVQQSSSIYKTSKYVVTCDTCTKPDIYFLIFDEYSNSTALKETWNYNNSDLDTFLEKKGFRQIPNSRSNYNFTEFSIASTLNMDYLQIPNPSACTLKDYNYCFERINSNQVCSILSSLGYDIVNYSIFDLQKNPSIVKEDFLPLKTKLITSQTFISRIQKDLFFHLLVGKFAIKWLSGDLIYSTYYNNQKIISADIKESGNISVHPKFVYSHIEMPHPPFYFNKYGQKKSKQEIIKDNMNLNISSYLDYLPKTNEVIKQIVSNILNNSKKPVAIVLMGDHGFREKQERDFQFRNLNAVYISSGNYAGFVNNISNVNEYAVLFNNLFSASIPLKKDSTIFLMDKK